ncbi:MAG: (d)CMP kinase [Pacificimonas sp.]
MIARDERDQGRAAAPLKIADDATLIDTTKLGIEASIAAALAAVVSALARTAQ